MKFQHFQLFAFVAFSLVLMNACEKSKEDETNETQHDPNAANQKLFLSEMAVMDSTEDFAVTGHHRMLPEDGNQQYRDKHPAFSNAYFYAIAAQAPNEGVSVPVPGPDDDVNDFSIVFSILDESDSIPPNAYFFVNQPLIVDRDKQDVIFPGPRTVVYAHSGNFTFKTIDNGGLRKTPDGNTIINSLDITVDPNQVQAVVENRPFCHCQILVDQSHSSIFFNAIDMFNQNGDDTTFIYVHQYNVGHLYNTTKNITPEPSL